MAKVLRALKQPEHHLTLSRQHFLVHISVYGKDAGPWAMTGKHLVCLVKISEITQ